MKRRRIGKRASRKMFQRTAKRVHKKNLRKTLSRGGYHL